MMRTFNDTRLYTRYEKFKAGELIFDYIFKNCIPSYDELIVNKHKNYSIYIYKIKNISIKIILNSKSQIFYDLSYNNVSQKNRFNAPNETIDFDDYQELLIYYFDKLLYSIYLSATDSAFKAKSIEDINDTFKFILKYK